MDALFESAKSVGGVKFRYDDDTIDRWNHGYAGAIFVIFSILVTAKQSVGEPIICWTHTFNLGHDDYVNNYCWVKNTYFLPLNEYIPHNLAERESKELVYYQWVPFFLIIQALMFFIPCLLWRTIVDTSSINVKDIIDTAIKTFKLDPDARTETIQYLAKHIDDSLVRQRETKEASLTVKLRTYLVCFMGCGRRFGNFLYIIYIFIKVFYLANILLQLYFLEKFLKIEYSFYGLQLLLELVSGRTWQTTKLFPRVTMCDFKVRVLGNLNSHTVQCVLPINMFNEKIFIFVWFFLVILAIATAINLIIWLFEMWSGMKSQFVKKYLKLWKIYDGEKEKKVFSKFMNSYLRVDGVFCLKLIYKNTGELVIGDIVQELWNIYKKKQIVIDLMKSNARQRPNSRWANAYKKAIKDKNSTLKPTIDEDKKEDSDIKSNLI